MIFKGNFLYTPALGELTVREGEYLVVDGEKCAGFYRALPQEYAGQSVTDFGRALVLPAFCDLHLHAPQMVNRGVGYDQELLPWLETYTFPVEARYGDADFAEAAWKRFLNRMWANGTLRFSAFATIHKEAAWRLMELTERAGLSALIGKVNMDRNAPDSLREDTDASLADTEELICRSRAELKHVGYILTPRFVPSTTPPAWGGWGSGTGCPSSPTCRRTGARSPGWASSIRSAPATPRCTGTTACSAGGAPSWPTPSTSPGGRRLFSGRRGSPWPTAPSPTLTCPAASCPCAAACRRGCAAAWPAMWPAATPPP